MKRARLSSNNETAATKQDVAAYLRVTVRTVENLMREGVLPFYRCGTKLVRFDMDQVKQTLAERSQNRRAA